MTQRQLHLLSAGAAQGLCRALAPDFESTHGLTLHGTYGAVGAMQAKLLAGEPCDVLILSQALIQGLQDSGQVQVGSARALGVVKTALALKQGVAAPALTSPHDLHDALQRANGIYFPDPTLATAGIHFMKVLQQLGLADSKAAQLRPFANGATAMKAMAECEDPHVIGCTQATEILATPGVNWVGDLPAAFELATPYLAAVTTHAHDAATAQAWVNTLCDPHHAATRQACGFLAMSPDVSCDRLRARSNPSEGPNRARHW